jgi:hypothetical protein
MKSIRNVILILAALAIAATVSCGGMEPPQDEPEHYIVNVKTGETVARYAGHGMYELIDNRIPAEHLWKLYPQPVWMVLEEGPHHVVVKKGRQHFLDNNWLQYAEKKDD